ncbi:tRNA (adenosine(37)-N6)-dimethylallyltransferase MiaA [Treponema sp.]|uniref:tRNA (adenosine(37)-N6)-dimethylallyltransferase MiaA n=1 Tax=Treponema sp. TaxID=166 RepID=UPI00298DDADB|nr:tRNA (adenosine(37)-N6)-dimethylallyltransferase MiaA [Treponema sp.]MCR5612987.1 tRNA (adenosine(37)-N6)-dimethylallyltransferase MiaA [Treponema sp.]
MNKNKIPVIVIFAPTATGKTALTEKLFGSGSHSFFKDILHGTEIISADSMAVYKGMDIGTAKPDKALLQKIPHHMIDLFSPDVQFTVSEFVERADSLCSEIYSRKKIPVISGGTGFYIRNFLLGLPDTPESDPVLRERLKSELESSGREYMYEKLKTVDPQSAEKIHPNDSFRLLRALEVFYLTGKPRSSFELSASLREQYNFLPVILERDREDLYQRIDMRVEQMFENGLVNEVVSLMNAGYKKDDPGMQAIGYREFFTEESIDKIKERIKYDSHLYAKKQYVFMKGIPGARTFFLQPNQDYTEELIKTIENFIYNFE